MVRLWRTPLDLDAVQRPRGKVFFIPARCKGCELCITYCPKNALALSDKLNEKGYHLPEFADPDACVACGLCEMICPEFAVYVEEVTEEAKSDE